MFWQQIHRSHQIVMHNAHCILLMNKDGKRGLFMQMQKLCLFFFSIFDLTAFSTWLRKKAHILRDANWIFKPYESTTISHWLPQFFPIQNCVNQVSIHDFWIIFKWKDLSPLSNIKTGVIMQTILAGRE